MEKLSGLTHLFITIFLYSFSSYMVIPAITDVTMSAVCPGKNECSFAIYLTGFQQVMIGMGTMVMMPLVGNLSDKYGRKALLTFPMTLTIFPLVILAYNRTSRFFYAYYVLKTLTSMLCEGSVLCLALAYVADNVPERRRVAAFGILSGVASAAFVGGTFSTRFLSTSSTFQVAASVAVLALLHMKAFLPKSITDDEGVLIRPMLKEYREHKVQLDHDSESNTQIFRAMPSLEDMISLLKSSSTFSQAASVAFFNNLTEVGLHTSLMYYLKARFQFSKDQFADLMVIAGIAGTISQLILMPMIAPAIGEVKMLSIGLFFSFTHIFLYSFAWSFWVPYFAGMLSVLVVFASPCIRSIASKQVGPTEQGKAQGCISGISSVANVISPLVFTPLTAWFLSDDAPFHFMGFSIMCIGFASMIAFVQSLMIRAAPPTLSSDCNVVA